MRLRQHYTDSRARDTYTSSRRSYSRPRHLRFVISKENAEPMCKGARNKQEGTDDLPIRAGRRRYGGTRQATMLAQPQEMASTCAQ
jgi:hypothetical protein